MQTLPATLLNKGPYARSDAPYRLLEVAGPDAGEFLQRLCSADVEGLADGAVAPAAFLDAKGKVQATVLVLRRDREAFWLETQAAQAQRLHELLDRYHFTEKLTLALRDAGPVAETIAAAAGDGARDVTFDEAGPTVRFARRGVQFTRRHGADGGGDGAAAAPATFEALRMAAGLVAVGVETEPSTLALEADLDDHCSTTKGCYTGQEIVARIHTYGHVNRKLCLLQLPTGEPIDGPVTLVEPEDELPVGRVLHAVPLDGLDARLGLGYLPKDFQEPGTTLALEGGGAVEVIGF